MRSYVRGLLQKGLLWCAYACLLNHSMTQWHFPTSLFRACLHVRSKALLHASQRRTKSWNDFPTQPGNQVYFFTLHLDLDLKLTNPKNWMLLFLTNSSARCGQTLKLFAVGIRCFFVSESQTLLLHPAPLPKPPKNEHPKMDSPATSCYM